MQLHRIPYMSVMEVLLVNMFAEVKVGFIQHICIIILTSINYVQILTQAILS